MKITIKLICSMIVVVGLVAGVFSYFNIKAEKGRLLMDIEHRAWLAAQGIKESAASILPVGDYKKLDRIIEKMSTSERIAGIAVYDVAGDPIAVTNELEPRLSKSPDIIFDKFDGDLGKGVYEKLGGSKMYLYALPFSDEEGDRLGTIVIFNEASYIDSYVSSIWKRTFLRLLANAMLISVVTLLLIKWSVMAPINRMSKWMDSVKKGENDAIMKMPKEDLFAPISKELSGLAKSLAMARSAAEEEAKLRQNADSIWTRDKLKEHVKARLGGKRLIVISNREPYMHVRRGKHVDVLNPASGLITAIDPLLKACDGLWVAHGAGSADKETVDNRNIIRVPPDNPQYDLKRVWLTAEEEEGYYYGFSNEGLWPLCHIAHTRPIFRADDWARYQEVNYKFARTLDDVMERDSVIFIQDYHFSILPRLIKDRHPDSKIALFWHIPWPNPEAFGICPWKREIVHGMLGADIIGFHTQFHCNNFLETVDRTLECQTDWEHFTTTRLRHKTIVKPFPISVDFSPEPFSREFPSKEELFKNLGVKASILGVGVDRVDYTKGIPERFRSIERFFEKNPEYMGMFTFVQIGAPSREHIKRYHDLLSEVETEAERINWKFQAKEWKPIVFIKKHLSHAEIEPYYKRADLCLVNSLHDGMNLVAKEFVASRADEKGVLILSTFAGASRELKDALLINPYDIEQTADMIKSAIEMTTEDQRLRMIRLRNVVRENNIYKWAANVITDLTELRTEKNS